MHSQPPFRLSAHLGYMFTEQPLEARFAAARAAGFDAIEYPAPYDIPAARMAQLLRDNGLTYVQFGLRIGNAAAGEKGIGIFADRREEFAASLDEALDYAEAVGVRLLHPMAGVLPEDRRGPEHESCYIDNLGLAAERAAARGIDLFLEAMSPRAVPDYYLSRVDDAARVVRAVGAANLGLLLDVFHTAAVGEDPAAAIRSHAPMIRHVHLADLPHRQEPGHGEIDYSAVRQALRDIGYDGWLGCEYTPAAGTEAGLHWRGAFR